MESILYYNIYYLFFRDVQSHDYWSRRIHALARLSLQSIIPNYALLYIKLVSSSIGNLYNLQNIGDRESGWNPQEVSLQMIYCPSSSKSSKFIVIR